MRSPARNRDVYVVGAGLSSALGLPTTTQLLSELLELGARPGQRRNREQLPRRLADAFAFFYPDGAYDGYVPDVVDFFSTLRTYADVGRDLAGGFGDAGALHRTLKFALAELLVEKCHAAEGALANGHPFLDEMLQPGNIVVTSNWDLLLERYAQVRGIPLRLSGTASDSVVLLKLHGSIDWCLGRDMRAQHRPEDFALLSERLFAAPGRRLPIPDSEQRADVPLRIRTLEMLGPAWNLKIRTCAVELLMVTMTLGKAGALSPLRRVWRDAYGAISRARSLELVGYSLPHDDIEIRTLLRAGVRRGTQRPEVAIRNPDPHVHERVRRYLTPDARSVYNAL